MENAQQPDKMLDDEALVCELKCCVIVIRGYTQLLMREHQKVGLEHPCFHHYTAAILEQTERLTAVVHRSRRQT